MLRKAFACAALFAVACGGPQKPPEPSEAEPPWVKDYQRVAREGCACGDDEDCLDAAHAQAVELEAAHGGIDDAPPSVQVAHGELDRCWREGTLDLGRDLGDAVDQVCQCREPECINLYRIQLVKLQEKYKIDLGSPDELDPATRETTARASVCIAKVSVPADEYLQAFQRRADTVCRCDTRHCVETSARVDFGDRFYVADEQSVATDVELARDRYCSCMGGIVAKEHKDDPPEEKKADTPKVDISVDPLIRCPT